MSLDPELTSIYQGLELKYINEDCSILKAILIEVQRLSEKAQSFFSINCSKKVRDIKDALQRLDTDLSKQGEAAQRCNIDLTLYKKSTDDTVGSIYDAIASQRISLIGTSSSQANVAKAFNT
jgi:hypothetical protein